jgi:hypothetical protein
MISMMSIQDVEPNLYYVLSFDFLLRSTFKLSRTAEPSSRDPKYLLMTRDIPHSRNSSDVKIVHVHLNRR